MKATIVTIGALLLWSLTPARAQCPDTCNSGTCSNDAGLTCSTDAECVAAAVEAACPCTGASNHGRHQSCVVHLRNQLRKAGCPTADIARCNARSTCGKPTAVLCCKVASAGTCTIPVGSLAGTCSNDATVTCSTDAECTVLSGPRIRHDATSCTDNGGYLSGTGSVCQGCSTPVACCLPSGVVGEPGTCAVLSGADCAAQSGTSTAGAAPTCSGVTCL